MRCCVDPGTGGQDQKMKFSLREFIRYNDDVLVAVEYCFAVFRIFRMVNYVQ